MEINRFYIAFLGSIILGQLGFLLDHPLFGIVWTILGLFYAVLDLIVLYVNQEKQ